MTLTANDIPKILAQAPVRVNFAGLQGDTAKMRQDGWELNVHSEHAHYRDSLVIGFSGVHRGYNLKMFSSKIVLDYSYIAMARGNALRMLVDCRFEVLIKHVSEHMIFSNYEKIDLLASNWNGVMNIVEPCKQNSFEEYFEFPEVGKTLIIPENKIWTVQEHLDAIRSVQQPGQDEILRSAMEKRHTKDVLKLIAC